ncbi:response regulator [Desertivirga brevis]|uniref:response regulator n=1 Tax=Desertivirga brevis TaxID=2810310 RepID=UPI001A95993B|nr:response regulator [Pedobacter sp. SYSU D00873]
MCFVYVIDDDPIHQKITEILIRKSGAFKKHTAFPGVSSAIEALQLHKNEPENLPDVILLDLNMPVLDGWDFLDQFKDQKAELQKNIQVFIVSSSAIQSEIDRSTQYSFVKEFITKPLDTQKLIEISSLCN